jgi:hypothetical protein
MTDKLMVLPFHRLSTVEINGIVPWYQLVRWWARVCREGRRVGKDFMSDSTAEVVMPIG